MDVMYSMYLLTTVPCYLNGTHIQVLLSNKPHLTGRAKYRLKSLVRTQVCDDESYNAVFECQDEAGNGGIRLSKKIVEVAGNAMKINLTNLGPHVLPLSEQLRVVLSIFGRR